MRERPPKLRDHAALVRWIHDAGGLAFLGHAERSRLANPEDYRRLGLDGLDAPAMDLLAAEIAGHLDEPTRAALVERAAGNPLFLEEMTRMVSTSGVIDAHALPANVRSVIGARLDVLDERARSVLGDAAVLGLRGTREALRTMSTYTQGDDDIAAAMTALERADLLELTTKQWAFRSNVVRDVVYDRLTKTQRVLRHAGVAEWLASHRVGDADTIAMHFRQAAALVDEVGGVDGAGQDLSAKAIEWTLRTLDTEQAGSSLDQVVELQSAALDLAGAVDPRRRVVPQQSQTREDFAWDPFWQQPGGEQLGFAGRIDTASPVEIDFVVDDPRQPVEDIVVQRCIHTKAGLQCQDVLTKHTLGRFQCPLARVALCSFQLPTQNAQYQRKQHDGHEKQIGITRSGIICQNSTGSQNQDDDERV